MGSEIRYIVTQYPWLCATWGAVVIYWLCAFVLLLRRLKRSRPAVHAEGWIGRLPATILEVVIQRSIWRSWRAGLMHLSLFMGATLILIAFVLTHFVTPRGQVWQDSGPAHLLNDIGTLMVLLGLALAAWRRHVRRETPSSATDLALWALLLVAALTSLASTGLIVAIVEPSWRRVAFLSNAIGRALSGIPQPTLRMIYGFAWSVLHADLLGLAILAPLSKWRHILLAPLSHLTRQTMPLARWAPLDLDGDGPYGAVHAQDLTGKQSLDILACTRCGRCSEACPAVEAGRSLDPLAMIEALAQAPGERVLSEQVGTDAVWDCTTCMACTEVCPVGISPLSVIVDLRRERVLEAASFPASLQGMFRGLERRGNPWNLPPQPTALDQEGLGLRVLREGESCDVLLWIGCMGRYDHHAAKTVQRFADILRLVGVDVATLGDAQICCGDPARRAGNEYLWRQLARKTLNTLNKRSFGSIVGLCPHCINTLANEYGDLGAHLNAIHATTFLALLLKENRLPRLASDQSFAPQTVTYHDPCYLGRGNEEYEAARTLLAALPGVALQELARHGREARCCGAGGAQMWIDDAGKPELGQASAIEIESALDSAGVSMCVTACPYCTRMLADQLARHGAKTEIVDLVDLVADRLEATAVTPECLGEYA